MGETFSDVIASGQRPDSLRFLVSVTSLVVLQASRNFVIRNLTGLVIFVSYYNPRAETGF